MSGATLFLFAHQDDEVAIFHCIENELRIGRKVICAFLTDGGSAGVTPQVRNQESLAVLTRLGVAEGDILFIGEASGIRDLHLYESLDVACSGLAGSLQSSLENVETIYCPAWEGGHPDHDATHLVARRFAASLGHSCDIWQFPLYHGEHCPGPFFKAFSPLEQNGPVCCDPVSWHKRWQYLSFAIRLYPSVLKTWIGLVPFLAYHYLVHGCQSLQRADNVLCRPHLGRLYYEKRRFASFDEFWAVTAPFREFLEKSESGVNPTGACRLQSCPETLVR
jgi:LmbE family N-acetylglucosaminyl deacetylase